VRPAVPPDAVWDVHTHQGRRRGAHRRVVVGAGAGIGASGSLEPTLPSREGRVGIDIKEEDVGDEPVLHIGEVAARTDLSLRSLRHWEEVGLLAPSGRSDGGFRLYTEADVDKILVIRRMKPLGFSLDEMKTVMADIEILADPEAGRAAHEAARRRLDDTQGDAVERRQKLVRQLEMADEFIDIIAARRG
jgi:MerR family transcriptional regulator, copper efflux regulator